MARRNKVSRKAVARAIVRSLPDTFRDAIQSNSEFKKKIGIKTASHVTIEGVSFEEGAFAEAVRSATGTPGSKPILQSHQGVEWTIEDAGENALTLNRDQQRILIGPGELYAAAAERRLKYFDKMMAQIVIEPPSAPEIRRQLAAGPPSAEQVQEMSGAAAHSPLTVWARLNGKLAAGPLLLSDLAETDTRYFASILGVDSHTAASMGELREQLHAARTKWIGKFGVADAFVWLVGVNGSADLSARDVLADTTSERIAEIAPQNTQHLDPFSLIGFLEAVADRPAQSDLDAVATRVVQQFISDDQWLERANKLYSALFKLMYAEFAGDPTLRDRPWFWRRVAAMSHAGLVTSALLSRTGDDDAFVQWARERAALEYRLTVAFEMGVAPRWLATWIQPASLKAEQVSRLRLIDANFPDAAKRWGLADALQTLREQAEAAAGPNSTNLAGPLDGARQTDPPQRSEDLDKLEDVLTRRLSELTGAERFGWTIFVSTATPVTQRFKEAVERVVTETTVSALLEDREIASSIIHGFGHAAAIYGSAAIADRVLELVFELDRAFIDEHMEALTFALIACSGAWRGEGTPSFLRRAMEALAFRVQTSEAAQELLTMLVTMTRLRSDMDGRFARAIAASRACGWQRSVQV